MAQHLTASSQLPGLGKGESRVAGGVQQCVHKAFNGKSCIFQPLLQGPEGNGIFFFFLLGPSGNNSNKLSESEEQKATLVSSLYARTDHGAAAVCVVSILYLSTS